MTFVLTTKSSVLCGHVGAASPLGGAFSIAGGGKLTVESAAVLVTGDVEGKLIKQTQLCGIVPSTGNIQCTKVSAVDSSSEAAKLTIEDKAVLLETLKGKTDGTLSGTMPQPLLNATPGQIKLSAV